jgi:protoheme IX farnesyltransferase
MQEKSITLPNSYSFAARIQDYIQLTKFRLSSLVVFSAVMGYLIATGNQFSWASVFLLSIGGFLVTGSSNAFNQIIEKDTDKLMDRTADRPLPSGRMSVSEAMFAAVVMGILGTTILWISFNPLTGILSLFSLLIYVFIYTPSKKITPFSVLIGAIPGALPPLLGWVAAKNQIGLEGLILYAIQFIWQFPHFWAIAWVLHDDYLKAGFKMLPGKGRTKSSAFQTLAYTLCLIPLGLFPALFGFANSIVTLLLIIVGVIFTAQSIKLYSDCQMRSAQKLMFGSFIYLPVVQIVWMIYKLF